MPEPSAHSQNPVDFPVRVAAVDLGSNALRFGAAEFSSPEEYRILENLRVPVRLGHGAFLTKYLDAALIDQAVEALKGFRRRMDDLGVGLHRAAATSAVRESRNAHELTARIWEEAAIRVDPISGIEEGRLVWRAISNRVPVEGRRWLLADLGGGSVEVSLASSGQLSWTESLPLGTVRLLEALGVDPEAPTTPLRRLLEEHMAALRPPVQAAGVVEGLIATGGNAEIIADLSGVPRDVRGVRLLRRRELHAILEKLASLTFRERVKTLGLKEDRADVILPAAIVYDRLAELAGTDTILVPGVGLKEGLMLELVGSLG